MKITLPELYKGKSLILKDKEYFSAKRYVEPFVKELESLSSKFIVSVKTPDQIIKVEDDYNYGFTRVHVQAVLRSAEKLTYNTVIGMVYSLDTKKPIVKFYKALMDTTSEALITFDQTDMYIQEIEPGELLPYSVIKSLLEKPSKSNAKSRELSDMTYTYDQAANVLGRLIVNARKHEYSHDGGKVKLASKDIITAWGYMFDEGKFKVEEGANFSNFDLLEAICYTISEDKKEIINKFEKYYLAQSILW